VTVKGIVTAAGVGTTVALWQRSAGQSSFHQVAHTTTDAGGTYTFHEAGVQTNRSWYATAGAARSLTLAEQVTARLSLSVRVVRLTHRDSVVLTGSVGPSHSGEWLRVEQRRAGHWLRLGRAHLNRRSRFTFRHAFAGAGTVTVRVSLAADHENAASVSRAVTVRL
jgi:hypothetical protein